LHFAASVEFTDVRNCTMSVEDGVRPRPPLGGVWRIVSLLGIDVANVFATLKA